MSALPSSGAISLNDIRAEFVGGSDSIDLQSLYKGSAGGNAIVRSKASNNSGTDLAPNIPASGAITFSNFYGSERAFAYVYSSSQTDQSAATVFGDDYAGNYKKRVTVNNGVTLSVSAVLDSALDYPSNGGGDLELINNGTINAVGSKGVDNNTSTTIVVTGNGTFTAGTRAEFVSALQSDGSVQINYLGGFGGASGGDIRHSDYGSSGFNSKLTRSGNTFTLSWTYNEMDYSNAGAGSLDISSMFPLSGSSFDYTNTSSLDQNSQVGAYNRDVRDIGIGKKVVSGTMYYWFGSNNKPTNMDVANNRYIMPGYTQTTLTTSNSQRSSVLQDANGTRREGNFDTSGFSGTDN